MLSVTWSSLRLQGNLYRTACAACKHNLKRICDLRQIHRSTQQFKQTVLGIETSCDDTGCAIVDSDGNLLGDALNSQLAFHNANGGVIPPMAANLHKKNIIGIVDEALNKAGLSMEDVSAVATTVKPGLGGPLEVGSAYGSYLAEKYKKPFIPIHHMEAHALAVRMARKDVQFPYLTLLISGGHTLLAIVRSVDEFELIGDTEGVAVGEVFDKVARRLKLLNLEKYRRLSGGRAIELAASKATEKKQYTFPDTRIKVKGCNFSMAGIVSHCQRLIEAAEIEHDLEADAVIPGVENFCAGLQLNIALYLCLRVQYAMTLVRNLDLIKEPNPFLVVSGGAACNQVLQQSFEKLCNRMDFRLAVPPPKLCTDNGVMIAWNGVERLLTERGIVSSDEAKNVGVEPSCPLGVNIIESINEYKYPCDWITEEELLDTS